MIARNTSLLFAGALVALTTTGSLATAQEAITLEAIGAVRMVAPPEAKRINEEAVRRQQSQQVRPVSLPRQQAELAQ